MASIFTQIINRELPSTIIFENERIIVIKNIYPEAKTHLLIIPKKEIPTINELQAEDPELMLELFSTAKNVAQEIGVIEGYKLYFNVGPKAQDIMHVHLHLLSDI